MRIATILEKIDENQLFVPAFQREYVWKRDDAKQLIDSLIKDYPTGTMLTWETANPPELKGPHKYSPTQGAVKLLLDGQQRVTTLYMLITGEVPPYYTLADITVDTRGLYVHLESLELLYYNKARMANNPAWQNITDIFKGQVNAFGLQADYITGGRNLSMEELRRLNDNINAITKIKDREFPEQTIPARASIREAIDIFYKVNSSGVPLTDAELALAQISGYWPQARDLFKAKLNELAAHGFDFDLDWLVFVLLGCLHHNGSDMRKLHAPDNDVDLRKAWGRLESQVLDYVVGLLRTHAYIDHSKEINSPGALVPIVVYCFDKKGAHLTDAEIRKLVKWYFYSQIRTRYVGQLPQKLDQDLQIVAEHDQPFDALLQVIAESGGLEITPNEFVGRAVQHPLFSMVNCYLKSRGAICFSTGLNLHKHMGGKYQLEKDHIFPYSRLQEVGYGQGNRVKYALAQELTNRVLLTQVANRSKANSIPSDYLATVKVNFPKALALQCMPEDPELWKLENYEGFLEERRKMLAAQLNAFLNNITESEETVAPVSIDDLIAEGESDSLEFKSTLRWDLKDGVINKKLEDVVVKTVAAFANSRGGTLLIGVADDGTVVGLEWDYQSLGIADRDKFELHLRNLLKQEFGNGFCTSRITVRFDPVGEREICRTVVTPSPKAVYVAVKDKNGQTSKKLFARGGNSSQEIPPEELAEFCKERFG